MKITHLLTASCIALAALTSCDKNGNLNVLSIDDDKKLGEQSDAQIKANPTQYPILPEAGNERAYAYVNGLKDAILASGRITYKDDFVWKVSIINDTTTLNAFCTPGGYIYVYTGLMKYLDNGDELAGVMGHEMGHADLRHSSRQITKDQGITIVSQVVLGEASQGALANVVNGLVGLKFSRDYEREADDASVKYLGGTSYSCDGAAGFFIKLGPDKEGGPEWMSTHPAPENRVADIQKKAADQGCVKTITTAADYRAMVATLP